MLKIIINTARDIKLYPAQLLQYLNENLQEQTSGNFVTAFYGVYNIETRTFRYARAGHNFPFLIDTWVHKAKTLPDTKKPKQGKDGSGRRKKCARNREKNAT